MLESTNPNHSPRLSVLFLSTSAFKKWLAFSKVNESQRNIMELKKKKKRGNEGKEHTQKPKELTSKEELFKNQNRESSST